MPLLVVPNNPRALILETIRYGPLGTDVVLDFTGHYGTSTLAAQPYHRLAKAIAESALQIVGRWTMATLRHRQFSGVREVNIAMKPLITRPNEKPL
jgi:hypothetical protein